MRRSSSIRIPHMLLVAAALSVAALQPSSAGAAELYGLTPGTVELKSAGPLAFGPSGVLFVGDAKAAKVSKKLGLWVDSYLGAFRASR